MIGGIGTIEIMLIGIILIIIPAVLLGLLYLVIKKATKDGIKEAKNK